MTRLTGRLINTDTIVKAPQLNLESSSPAAPKICQRLFRNAADASVSDLHIQPTANGGGAVAQRLDGVLSPVETLSPEVVPLVIGRIKFLARLKTYEHSLPQDGRISQEDAGLKQELRVSTFPTVTGEKVVVRFFTDQNIHQLDQLGLDLDTLKTLQTFLTSRRGLLLLTGPSGSGKTTTIYSCLRYLVETDSRHIITIEDPVEQMIEGVMQTEVNEARGLTYPRAIRHLLRQDPEVIVIGEIRDDDTAEIAIRAALTGHQVIATLHAGSCHGVINRLRVMVKDHFALTAVLDLIVNQRLARRQCGSCSGPGCEACSNTGYRRRVPVVETLALAETDRKRLQAGQSIASQPRPSLKEAAARLIELKATDEREISRILGS